VEGNAPVVAKGIMKVADRNRNGELSYTELTTMLGGSIYEDFGKWLDSQGSEGFRKYDADRQGSISLRELTVAVAEFLEEVPPELERLAKERALYEGPETWVSCTDPDCPVPYDHGTAHRRHNLIRTGAVGTHALPPASQVTARTTKSTRVPGAMDGDSTSGSGKGRGRPRRRRRRNGGFGRFKELSRTMMGPALVSRSGSPRARRARGYRCLTKRLPRLVPG